jgi:hypothetical protein
VPQHAHERHDTAPAADEEKRRPSVHSGPDEIASDGPAQLKRVVGLQLSGEERRNLAVLQAIDCELQRRRFGGEAIE